MRRSVPILSFVVVAFVMCYGRVVVEKSSLMEMSQK